MRLTFVAKDPESQPQGSPTLYHTDRASWVVQGWIVTDPEDSPRWTSPRVRSRARSPTGSSRSSGRCSWD